MYASYLCGAPNSYSPHLTYRLVALQRIIGVQPAWMRPPYGSLNDQVVAAVNARGQNCARFLMVLTILLIDKTPSSSGSLGLRLWRY